MPPSLSFYFPSIFLLPALLASDTWALLQGMTQCVSNKVLSYVDEANSGEIC